MALRAAVTAARRDHPFLFLLGVTLPLLGVFGTDVAANMLQDATGVDWDWYDEHQTPLQVGAGLFCAMVGLVLLRTARTRPVGWGVLVGLTVVLLVVAVAFAVWVAVVAIWIASV